MTTFKKDIDVNCSFCGSHSETVQHLFWICSFSTTFWKDFSSFIIGQLYKDFTLKWENVVFYFFRRHRREDIYFIINLLIVLAKFYLHKCKYCNQKPIFKHFYNDTLSYIKMISGSLNKKAIKTISICTTYKIFECK